MTKVNKFEGQVSKMKIAGIAKIWFWDYVPVLFLDSSDPPGPLAVQSNL